MWRWTRLDRPEKSQAWCERAPGARPAFWGRQVEQREQLVARGLAVGAAEQVRGHQRPARLLRLPVPLCQDIARQERLVFRAGQSILDVCEAGSIHCEVVVVASNNPEAYGLKRARTHGVPTVALDHKRFPDRESHEKAIIAAIAEHEPEVAVLAGYMRVITPVLIEHFYDRRNDRPGVINIHPADTRQYQGAHGYEFAMGMLRKHPQRLEETKITVQPTLSRIVVQLGAQLLTYSFGKVDEQASNELEPNGIE